MRCGVPFTSSPGGVDDQRIAVPVAARVPDELAHASVGTSVHRNDASAVDHLVVNHHVSRRLEKLTPPPPEPFVNGSSCSTPVVSTSSPCGRFWMARATQDPWTSGAA